MSEKRGKVWLGAGAVVVNSIGEWLVVKKTYSGLKGVWSIPAGFVQAGETVEEAAMREVLEETGIQTTVLGLIGLRSGVIGQEISDNMAIFLCTPINDETSLILDQREIAEAAWMHPTLLVEDVLSSTMIKEMIKQGVQMHYKAVDKAIDPGAIFNYTKYRVFFKDRKF